MDFDLSSEQVTEIQVLNAKMVGIKGLIKEATAEGNDALFTRLIGELAKVQIEYDGWFEKMQEIFKVSTRSDQRWNVDFKAKKLQLLG